MLDDIHKRKIDMADAIYVINKDGYVGMSTQSEILYAALHDNTPILPGSIPVLCIMFQQLSAYTEICYKSVLYKQRRDKSRACRR